MEKTGVELVVEGLSAFLSEMGKADKAVGNFGKSGSLLGTIFSKVGDVISGLIGGVFRILEYTLGNLLASAIQSVVGWLRDLAAGVLESADTFAKLEIRLKRMNFNAARDSGLEYNAAMEEAVRLTKEQLEWTIRLGAQTPFDAVDIAKVYTLARSYGFTAGESKSLTDAIIDFTSGMGLTNVEMERIVINFGQLRQQGKLNAQDLRDLARGAYVPINDVLAITAKKLGLTTEEFNKQRKAGTLGAEAVDVFRQSFEELVGVDFEGAAQDLGNVFSVAIENINHFIRDMLGAKIVEPVLTMIGTRIQEVTDGIVDSDETWNSMMSSIERISAAILGIVSDLLGLAPSADEIADSIVKGLDSVATWLEDHQDDIVLWVQDAIVKLGDIKTFIEEKVLPILNRLWKYLFGDEDAGKEGAISKFGKWLTNEFVPAVKDAAKWVEEKLIPFLRDDLVPVFEALIPLGEAVGKILITAFGGEPNKDLSKWIHEDLIPGIDKLTKFLVDNKDEIALWVNRLVLATLYVGIIIGAITLLIGWVGAVTTAFGKWLIVSGDWIKVAYAVAIVAGIVALAVNGILLPVLLVIAGIGLLVLAFLTAKAQILGAIEAIKAGFQIFKDNAMQTIDNVRNAFINKDWVGVGKAIIQGVINGIGIMVGTLVAAARNAAIAAYNAAKKALGIKSPSSLFMEIGEFSMKGMAIGIEKYAGLASDAMLRATSQMAMSGMGMMPSNTTNIQNSPSYNNTLNIHTSAQTEPLIADFEMMTSMAGV